MSWLVRAGVWLPGLVVTVAAAAATAHGLSEVALGCGTPSGIAWLYPVITDGLALVAYAAMNRLRGSGRRYACSVVVLAAGLSGLAQASYLAGGVGVGPAALRFGVGAWPALAAAIAAHLLHLLGEAADPAVSQRPIAGVPDVPTWRYGVTANDLGCSVSDDRVGHHAGPDQPVSQVERARLVAQTQAARTGALPTVRELAELAQVGRGTADRALSALRAGSNGSSTNSDCPNEGPQQ